MNAMHKFKIGQKVYMPESKDYWYINGITPNSDEFDCWFDGVLLYIHKEESKPTKDKATLKVSSHRVEAI